MRGGITALGALALAVVGCAAPTTTYDVVIRGGTVFDGTGAPGRVADVAIIDGQVVEVVDVLRGSGKQEIDATDLAVAPGFINMLSWAVDSLIADGRSLSDIRQGVTLEVFGEGWSHGPLNAAMKAEMASRQTDFKYAISWTTLGEYLDFLVARGVSPNVASYVGATTVRIHEIGHDDRAPTDEELARMQALVRAAMEEGAIGVGSSLIYAPAAYADTAELIALNRAAGEYGGRYISHLRSEGDRLLEAVDELIEIAREAAVPAEIYHLKAAGRSNWDKLDAVFARVEAARAEGLAITADMYNYPAGATGLDAAMPPWVQEGGHDAWVARLRDPAVRERLRREITTPNDGWENLFLAAGSPDNLVLINFKNPELRHYTGKTLAEVAALRGTDAVDTMMDLVVADNSRVGTVYFLMSEDNIKRQIATPWVSFGSDEASLAPEGHFLEANPHPRAYGNVARLLGHYVRDEAVIPLAEAIRRLTTLPAENLGIEGRGRLAAGFAADVVVFDPATVTDPATFDDPHRLAEGVLHVFVNGEQVLRGGEHTGALPGQVVRGPGWRGR